jgi:CheY-like chemotaxis protein
MGGLEAIRTLRGLERTHQVPIHYVRPLLLLQPYLVSTELTQTSPTPQNHKIVQTVVAVTGNARQAQIDECLASGFDETAIKPYVFADLLSQIKRYTAE